MYHSLVVRLLQFGVHKRTERCHADLCRFLQPHVAIDAGALVKPPLLQGGIGAHAYQVVVAVFDIGCDVVGLCGVTAGFGAHIKAVEPYTGIAEDAVEAQHQSLAQILVGYVDGFAIPSHAGFRVFVAHRLIAVRVTGFGRIGQCGHPVVRQLHLVPTVVLHKFLRVRSLVVYRVGLCQIVKILRAAAEVLLWVGSVSQCKSPSLVKSDGFAYALCIQVGS